MSGDGLAHVVDNVLRGTCSRSVQPKTIQRDIAAGTAFDDGAGSLAWPDGIVSIEVQRWETHGPRPHASPSRSKYSRRAPRWLLRDRAAGDGIAGVARRVGLHVVS